MPENNTFQPITSQEQLDTLIAAAVKDAVSRFSDYESIKASAETAQNALSQAQATINNHRTEVEGLNAKIAGLELGAAKVRVANEIGLPFEFSERLTGKTEDELREDAKNLQRVIFNMNPPAPPMGSAEPVITNSNSENAALNEWLRNMKGE